MAAGSGSSHVFLGLARVTVSLRTYGRANFALLVGTNEEDLLGSTNIHRQISGTVY